ncbi:MAG: thioredoxin-disulfide reductase [bacterium]|nr:thioredoxin-disulfide reductase [bacterium]
MENIYDVIIVGGGPAGLTAGLYASRSKLKTLLLERFLPGGQAALTDFIENYPGFPDGINGVELMQKMEAQAVRFGLQINTDEVTKVGLAPDNLKLVSANDTEYRAKSVIIATGAEPKKLGIPGELEFRGKGISYCATCDGPLFKGKDLAVIGGGDSAVEEGIYLTRFAKSVTLIHRRDQLRATKIIQERAFATPNLRFIWNSVPVEFIGTTAVEGVKIKNVKSNEVSIIPVSGVFIYIGLVPRSEMVKDLVALDESGSIITDTTMATSVPGIFAAGDVRKTILRQVAVAVGDGATAAYSAEKYIQ